MATQTKSIPLWRTQLAGVTLALLAAGTSALMGVSDTNVMSNVLASENAFASTLVYLTIGGWIGTLLFLTYNLFFGKVLDKNYSGLRGMPPKAHLFALAAGITGALGTAFYLYVAGEGDPSVIIALTSFVLVYVTIYDGIKHLRQTKSARFLIWGIVASLVVATGSAFAVVGRQGTNASIDFAKVLQLVLYLLVLSSGFMAVSSIYQDKAIKEYKVSPPNFVFWRFLWLGIAGTVAAIALAYLTNNDKAYWALLSTKLLQAAPWVAITMTFAYGANVFFALAQAHIEVSTASIIRASQAALAIPLTMAAVAMFPGYFSAPGNTSVLWLYRCFGITLMLIGLIIALRATPKKS